MGPIPIEEIRAVADRAKHAAVSCALEAQADRVLAWLDSLKPPEDPPPERGAVYEKRSHTKTSTNAPRIRLQWVSDSGATVEAQALNFYGRYGFKGTLREMRTTTLNESWRRVG